MDVLRRARRPAGRPPAPAVRPPAPVAAWWIAAVALLALALRLWGVRRGLPDFLDEAIPFRRAITMWDPLTGAVDWDPHFFHYPTLTLTLNVLLQKAEIVVGGLLGRLHGPADWSIAFVTDPTPLVVPARVLCVAFDVLAVAAVAAIGERLRRGAGVLAALLLACSPTAIDTALTLHADTFMLGLALLAVQRLLAWQRRGGALRLGAACALIGLAAGAKYPAAVLVLPLAFALWARDGARGLLRWPLAAAGALVAFLATTPYALLDRAAFVRDLGFVRGMAASGVFGDLGRSGLAFHLRRLIGDLGAPALALVIVSGVLLVLAWRSRGASAGTAEAPRLGERAVLWACLLAFAVPLALARVEAQRYVVPVVAFAALLAADAALALAARAPERWRRPAAALAVALLALPALAAGLPAAAADPDAPRVAARRWLEDHVTRQQLVLQESYGAPVLERMRMAEVVTGAVYRAASPDVQRAYAARRWLGAVSLPLAVVGTTATQVTARDGTPVTLSVAAHPADLNQAVYDPRLLEGVDLVVTSSAVRGRFEADRARYPRALAFYALLDSTATVAASFAPRVGAPGPTLIVYRLGDRTRAAVARLGPLSPLWWTTVVQPGYPTDYERAMLPPERRGREPALSADGVPATWVLSLAPLFRERYAPFARWLAMELSERRAYAPARRLAESLLLMTPDEVGDCLLYADAAGAEGAWRDAARAIERTERAVAAEGVVPGELRLQHAAALLRLGERDAARAELQAVIAGGDRALAAEAARLLGQ